MTDFHTYTCVRFESLYKKSPKQPFMSIEREKSGKKLGCKAELGFNGKKRIMFLSHSNCLMHGIIQHELMHILGFHHEHNRPDRNKYIKIQMSNVRKGYRHTFHKFHWRDFDEKSKLLQYDYSSVMHYSKRAFSKKKHLNTIVSLDSKAENVMGQRVSLSYQDIAKINEYYGCATYKPSYSPPVDNFGAPKNPFVCNFDGDFCAWQQEISQLMPTYFKNQGYKVISFNPTTDNFDWLRMKNSTPSRNTGPKSDKSGKGHYIYAESSFPRKNGDLAVISTTNFALKRDHFGICVTFWYHSWHGYGAVETGTRLNVYIKGRQNHSDGSNDYWKVFQSTGANQKNRWKLAKFVWYYDENLLNSYNAISVLFEAVIGDLPMHDLAIDEYRLTFMNKYKSC